MPAEDADATHLRRWFAEGADIRNDAGVTEEVLAFIDAAVASNLYGAREWEELEEEPLREHRPRRRARAASR